jgi:hypothetical protein
METLQHGPARTVPYFTLRGQHVAMKRANRNVGEFVCPVCNGGSYGAVRISLSEDRFESLLYRCTGCEFGFTELEQFVKLAVPEPQKAA